MIFENHKQDETYRPHWLSSEPETNMTAPQKLYGVTLKPHAKASRKLIEIPASEARPDLLEAVRRAVAENREAAEQRPQQ